MTVMDCPVPDPSTPPTFEDREPNESANRDDDAKTATIVRLFRPQACVKSLSNLNGPVIL
jgi:hypothetical protein